MCSNSWHVPPFEKHVLEPQNHFGSQKWVARQPVRLHAMGLRSPEDNFYPALIAAGVQAAPFIATTPTLLEAMGGESSQINISLSP